MGMSKSRAHQDEANVRDSLRRHGFGESGINSMLAMETAVQAEKDRLAKAVKYQETALDFGDWGL